MKFTDSSAVEAIVWQLKLADYPRAVNRSLVNDLANGMPPYDDETQEREQIYTNVNKLTGTKIFHDARRQFTQAFLVPNPLFTVTVDQGAAYKRQAWGQIITNEANRIIKGSKFFMETQRSGIAQKVLHGIDPYSWSDDFSWCPRSDGVEDILVPSNTLCSMENLPFFARYRSYTARELYDKTHGANVDAGWNIPLVEAACKWVDQQAQQLMSASWPEVWSPEKMSERVKQDGGLYASDAVPTIDVYDFYYWDNSENQEGWRRKMILDAWGFMGAGGAIKDIKDVKADRSRYGMEKSQFLYNSDNRKNKIYAEKLEHIIQWEFADCSSVAPFRYHSVRSLGWMIYSVCNLENLLFCKFNDSVFESLLQYFRVGNMADMERALKIDLTDKRPLPDGIQFVKSEERWKVDQRLVQMAMGINERTISENSENFVHAFDSERGDSETATRTMAKAASSSAMISAMLGQAYLYKTYQYKEIMRRLCMDTTISKNVDANRFRTACMRQGVPAEALDVNRMSITPTKIVAGGNKIMQIAMMDKIMGLYYPRLDPSSQREVLRMGLSITTDDYELASRWVPEQPQVSGSKHDAQLSAGLMLAGLPMDFKEGVNHEEYAQSLLVAMQVKIQQIQASGKPIEQQELLGLQNIAGQTIDGQPLQGGNGVVMHLEKLKSSMVKNVSGIGDDDELNQKIKSFGDQLGKMMNNVKAMAQQAAEMAKKQQQQGSQAQLDPKDAAKIQGMITIAQTKAQLAAQSHAQRTAQRQVQWELEQKREAEKHGHEIIKDVQVHRHDMKKDADHHALDVAASRLKSLNQPNGRQS